MLRGECLFLSLVDHCLYYEHNSLISINKGWLCHDPTPQKKVTLVSSTKIFIGISTLYSFAKKDPV